MQTLQNWNDAALIIVDPQMDLLSPEGGAWDLFGEQVGKRGTVKKLAALRAAAERSGVPVFYSRVELSDEDYANWDARNGLQQLMGDRKLFAAGGGARWLPELTPGPDTIVLSPRKGPSSTHSNVREQLQQRGIETIVVAGMVANLCVESQVRDAVDDGFRVVVVGDAIATLSDDVHEATLGNFGLLATEVVSTEDVTASLAAAGAAVAN